MATFRYRNLHFMIITSVAFRGRISCNKDISVQNLHKLITANY